MPIPPELERYVPLFQEFGLVAAGKAPHKQQTVKELERLGFVEVSPHHEHIVDLTPIGEQILIFFLECLRDAERVAVSAALQAATTVLASIDGKKLN